MQDKKVLITKFPFLESYPQVLKGKYDGKSNSNFEPLQEHDEGIK